jgi:hypothetical protein
VSIFSFLEGAFTVTLNFSVRQDDRVLVTRAKVRWSAAIFPRNRRHGSTFGDGNLRLGPKASKCRKNPNHARTIFRMTRNPSNLNSRLE